MEKEKEKAKAAGEAFFEAYRDGTLEAAEREGLLVAALGVETYQEALIKVGDLARESGVPVKELADALTTGKPSPEIATVLERAATAAERTERALNKPGIGGKGRSEEVKAAVAIADAYERTAAALERSETAATTLSRLTYPEKVNVAPNTRPGGGRRTYGRNLTP